MPVIRCYSMIYKREKILCPLCMKLAFFKHINDNLCKDKNIN